MIATIAGNLPVHKILSFIKIITFSSRIIIHNILKNKLAIKGQPFLFVWGKETCTYTSIIVYACLANISFNIANKDVNLG
jgi:hypothetical protein